MSQRLDKVKLVKGSKWERMDSLDNIGVSTYALLKDAIKEGRNELAKDLTDYLYFWEIKFVLDANIDLVGGFPSFWMSNYGEDGLYEVYRELLIRSRGVDSWPVPPVKKRDVSPFDFAMEDHVWNMVRLHRMGRNDGTGGFTIEEYEDRYEILWDPCYTGGRTRRGDPISGTPPHTAPPYNFAVTQAPHTWTGGKTGVSGYCIHCYILHELMEIEQTGYLGQWVVAYPENPWEPCPYICYKDVDWIPEEYYTQLGKTKPKPTSKVPKPENPKLLKVTHSDELGPLFINTVPRLKKAIDAGNKEEALRLVDQLNAERRIHRYYPLTWLWLWMDFIVERYGYNELYHALRSIHSRMEPLPAPDEPKPTKANIPSAEERARRGALWGRGSRSGPDEECSVRIIDEPDRIVMELDPCGSVGQGLMRIDSVDDITAGVLKELKRKGLEREPWTEPPWNFKVTTVAHPVAWGKVRVPHLCARCCVHFEMDAIARTGYLTTVVERPENAKDPSCRWFFYKDLDDIPEEYYTRIGARKPARQP